jgi:hypothetical protein
MHIPTLTNLRQPENEQTLQGTLLEELFPDKKEAIEQIKIENDKKVRELEMGAQVEMENLRKLAEVMPHNKKEKDTEEINKEIEHLLKYIYPNKNIEVRGMHSPCINEGSPSEPFYVQTANETTDIIKFLALSNVDLSKVEPEILKKFIETEKDTLKIVFDEGYIKLIDLQTERVKKIRETMEQPSTEVMRSLADKESFEEQDFKQLEKLLIFKTKIGTFSEETEDKLTEGLYKIIDKYKGARDSKSYGLVQHFCLKNEELLWHALLARQGEKISNTTEDMETFMKELYHLDGIEIRQRRFINEEKTRVLMRIWAKEKKRLTVDTSRELHKTMNKGILPFFALGLRSDNFGTNSRIEVESRTAVIAPKNKAEGVETTSKDKVTEEIGTLMEKANSLIEKGPKYIFEIGIANLTAQYAKIHPHPDGNGTMALLFAEMCFINKGYTEITEKVAETPFKERLMATFRKNVAAIVTVTSSYMFWELGQKKVYNK